MIDFKPKSNIQFTPAVKKEPVYEPERGVSETGFFKPTPKLRVRDVAREFMNVLTPGAVGFGQSIAGGLQRFTPEQKALEKSRETTRGMETQVMQRIKEKRERGEDTSRLQNILKQTIGKETSDFEINKALSKTTGQVLGESGEVLLDVLLAGTYSGLKSGAKFGKLYKAKPVVAKEVSALGKAKTFKEAMPSVVKGAGIGYGYDVARGLQKERGEEREGGKAFIPGLGTAIGGGIPLAMGGQAQITKLLRKKSVEEVEKEVSDTVGKIIQGKIKDRPRALKVLEEIDTEGVKTFGELGGRIKEKSSAVLKELDKFLDKQIGSYKVKDLTTKTVVKSKIGKDVVVKQNFVSDALGQLKELYRKIKAPRELAEITILERKLKAQGLTVKEINNLSRMYGREFGKKAFSKVTKEPLTSINAQAYENTRKGLKSTARGKIRGDIPKTMDEKVSNMINTENLIAKMEEKVSQLNQRIEKRGLGEKLGRIGFNVIDIITGRTMSGFLRAGFIPRGGGLKTLNALDIEKNLNKNLKILEKLLKTTDDNTFIKGIKEMFGSAIKSGTERGFAKIPGIKKPSIKDVISGRALPKVKAGMSIEDVSKKKVDSGFKGLPELTLKTVEKLKGKTTVNKQFISDLTNSPDLRQAERDMIRKVLQEMPEGKVNVQQFADKVKTELLPLGYAKTGLKTKYESVTLSPEIRGNVANYSERIYESPIKTSAGNVHFSGETKNYFAHTRIEDINYKGGTRRIIELQSDLFQRGGLESEVALRESRISKLTKESDLITKDRFGNTELAPKGETLKNINTEKQQLQPYSNTWHERIIKEEIKQASKDGKTKLQFPTGETAMKIEGLSTVNRWLMKDNIGRFAEPLNKQNLKTGKEILLSGGRESDNWIITDVLGDGKFKATTKEHMDDWLGVLERDRQTHAKFHHLESKPHTTKNVPDSYVEQFDISGKIDTSNPIYRFYEKEVQRYLKRIEPEMKLITDEQGVKWFEIPISKAQAKEPITAFGKAQIGALIGGAGVTAPSAIGGVIKDRIKYKAPEREKTKSNTQSIVKGLAYAETRGEEKPYLFSQWSNPALKEKSPLGKALGKYQITEARLKEKTQEFLGAVVTPKEFLENPFFQDKFIKKQIEWQRKNGLTDKEIMATHRHGWGNMTSEQLSKAVKQRKNYIKEVETGMSIKNIITQRAK